LFFFTNYELCTNILMYELKYEMDKHLFKTELKFISQGYEYVIGVDEAGRGPLAGPVVAAAVALRKNCHSRETCPQDSSGSGNPDWIPGQARNDKEFDLVRDSKLLSEKQREELYDFILENFDVGIGICDHKTIDRVNILQATYLAMKKAITDLNKKLYKCHSHESGNPETKNKNWIPAFAGMTKVRIKKIILVDGNKVIPNLSMEQKSIIGGDKIVKSISAASIIAKVTRDRIMREYHKKYPMYDFAQHKGYGTKTHREMIKKHGFCGIHRRSFKVK